MGNFSQDLLRSKQDKTSCGDNFGQRIGLCVFTERKSRGCFCLLQMEFDLSLYAKFWVNNTFNTKTF